MRLDPGYAEAHINLGAQYVYLGRLEDGLGEFSRATKIAGPSALVLCDMAYAEIRLRRFRRRPELPSCGP